MKVQMEFDVVIGLEVHCQLNTQSKIFASDHNSFGDEPNENISVLTLAHPGVLPRTNRAVVESAVKLGLAFGSEINRVNYFDRKNYFYPDLPKGYQITQDAQPICIGGAVSFMVKEGREYKKHTVQVHHIHMEEDAGKSVHGTDGTLLDYNRAGAPLLEIVSYPCISSPEEAAGYLAEIRRIVRNLGISDGNMEEGSLRADLNVSLKPKGSSELGTKVEIKNMNSIRFLQRAAEYEVKRQSDILRKGGQIIQETRTFIPETGVTEGMRVKETANDYRYFPEPDLAPIEILEEELHRYKAELPALPVELFERFVNEDGLLADQAFVLAEEKEWSEYYLETCQYTENKKAVANWLTSTIRGELNESTIGISDYPIRPDKLAELIQTVDSGVISHTAAQKVLNLLKDAPDSAVMAIAEENGWVLTQDSGSLGSWIDEVLEKHSGKVQEYKKGKKGLLGLFVGEVMKLSGGSADPKEVNKLLIEKLK
jgi:aspartyl-tRNA(Asn)/glutamyl-tRNA(Gln) amidotransferase subunit B